MLGWTSWQALITGTFLGLALAVCGGALIAAHRASRTSQLPLGPFMLAGALAAIVLLGPISFCTGLYSCFLSWSLAFCQRHSSGESCDARGGT
ncbi:MAG TPA: hypothetical protein VGI96_24680 [Streptosporangiaceae bacterium]